jgi:glutathione S-transferase
MWTLGELGLDYERHDMAGSFGTSGDYRQLNPNAVVPTIQDGDLTLYESNACVRYLARSYGNGDNSLWPTDNKQLALADQWMDWQCSTFSGAFFLIFFNTIRLPADKANPAQIEKGIAQCGNLLGQMENQLADKKYLVSDQLSMADIALGTHLYRYFTMEIARPGLPNVEQYYTDLSSRPAYQKHVMIPFGRNVKEWDIEEQHNAGIQ